MCKLLDIKFIDIIADNRNAPEPVLYAESGAFIFYIV